MGSGSAVVNGYNNTYDLHNKEIQPNIGFSHGNRQIVTADVIGNNNTNSIDNMKQ